MGGSDALFQALIVDIIVIITCTMLLLRHARMRHSHPAIIYLLFHVLSFTWRLWALVGGALPMFADWPTWEQIKDQEYVRAILVADATLFVMTIAWIKASVDDQRFVQRRPQYAQIPSREFSVEAVWLVIIPTFIIGLLGLFYFSKLPGANQALAGNNANLGAWGRSTWLVGTQMWSGAVLLILIHRYGSRWKFVVPLIIYILIMMYQGGNRSRAIIPSILLLQIILDQLNLKWPQKRHVIVLILLMLSFLPMKEIARLAQSGASLRQIGDNSLEILSSFRENGQVFLDQFAITMTLSDDYGKRFHFKTYLPILTFPIPRPLYPGKIHPGFYIYEISTSTRPMGQQGMTSTFHGQSYAAFGYIGIFSIAYILAYILGRTFHNAYRRSYESVYRFVYLMISASLIQVYRDGMLSIILFTTVYMMPAFMVIIADFLLKSDEYRLKMWQTRFGSSNIHPLKTSREIEK